MTIFNSYVSHYQRVCFRWHQQIWILVDPGRQKEQVDEYWRLAEAEFHCRSNGW